MLKKLRKKVYEANMLLPKHNLVTFTWGNVSGYDAEKELVVIKPSGVDYGDLTPEKMVIVNLKGDVIEGNLTPSSDTFTHIELYKKFPNIRGVVHTHSPWAVSFAQAGMPIINAGTTQADYFYGDIPVTRSMETKEIEQNYEKNTGKLIVETFNEKGINPDDIPGILVNDHGPFNWGASPQQAVHNAVVLEEVANMTYHSMQLNSENVRISQELLDKHYFRKHGKDAYYGQSGK